MEGMGFDISSQGMEMTEVLATANARIVHGEDV